MPVDQTDPVCKKPATAQRFSDAGLSTTLPRFSIRTGLTVFLSAGLLLFLLNRINYLLIHTLIEFFCIVLVTAVFLVGWKTRHLVCNQFFTILAAGFLTSGMVDLLHTLAYKGLQIIPVESADESAQLWLIARTFAALAFLLASFSLGRQDYTTDKGWLLGFLLFGLSALTLVWPLDVFPTCFVEGEGPTPFNLGFEYALIALLCLAAVVTWRRRKFLNHHLVTILILAISVNILSELIFTLYVNVYGGANFLGHYLKLGSIVLVNYALTEGTIRSPFETIFREMGQSYDELDLELKLRLIAEKQHEVAHQEASLLYRLSRAMHNTLNLDELSHLTLSAATGAEAGGFERATLFTVNKRTGMLQGMLGIARTMTTLPTPAASSQQSWERLPLDTKHCEEQRMTPFNQKVIKQRLPLDRDDNALAKAFLDQQVVMVSHPGAEPAGGCLLAEALELGPYACAPMIGRDQIMGVLLVDNPFSKREIPATRKRFLELFASQAGAALDNANLVKRLEMAHANLQDIQEQLIHNEKMAVLGEMAAQVAHELRNPLVAIGGFAQRLAKQDLKDPRANEYSEIIAREVRRMEEMLGNILSFSKKRLVCLDDCDIRNVLQEVFDLEQLNCERQGVNLVSDLQAALPNIMGDPRQLQQVFLNLVINARQAMGEGGVLTVRARQGALRGERAIVVEVEDTGGGISPEVMRNMFNPFFSTFAKGTGLGLSISHRIVAQHHGSIEVINGERGARFIVLLPLAQPGVTEETVDVRGLR